MSKKRLEHSLEELFSDFAPPEPKGESGPLPLSPHDGVDSPSEKKALGEEENNTTEEKKTDQRGNNSPSEEDKVRTWRAGWRNLASEKPNNESH